MKRVKGISKHKIDKIIIPERKKCAANKRKLNITGDNFREIIVWFIRL